MLSYTSETVYAFLEGYNEALWPAQGVGMLLGIFVLLAAFRPVAHGGRTVSALLAGVWLWIGLVYYWSHFAEIDFTAPVFAGFFVLQAALFIWAGVIRDRLVFSFESSARAVAGLMLAVFGLAGYPLVAWLSGLSLPEIQMFGIAPAPTVIFTLGLLLMASPRLPWVVTVIPLVWTAVAGTIAWFLEMPVEYCATAAGFAFIAVIVRTGFAARLPVHMN